MNLTLRHSLKLTALALLLCAQACSSHKSAKNDALEKSMQEGSPLVRVGDEKINDGYLKFWASLQPGTTPPLDNPMIRKKFVEDLVEKEILYQEALNRKIDQSELFQNRRAYAERDLISQSLLLDELDKKAKEYYETNKAEFERVRISHIFFSSSPVPALPKPGVAPTPPSDTEKNAAEAEAEKKAKEAYTGLKSGKNWDDVAKSFADPKGLTTRSGDFGYLSKKDMRIERMEYKNLVDTAFSLSKETYSEPIKAKDGWHIIKVTEEKKLKDYNEAQNEIKRKLGMKVREDLMTELKKKYKVQLLDPALAESQPAADVNIPPPPAPQAAPQAGHK